MSQTNTEEFMEAVRAHELAVNIERSGYDIKTLNRLATDLGLATKHVCFLSDCYYDLHMNNGEIFVDTERPRRIHAISGRFMGLWAILRSTQYEDIEEEGIAIGSVLQRKTGAFAWVYMNGSTMFDVDDTLRENRTRSRADHWLSNFSPSDVLGFFHWLASEHPGDETTSYNLNSYLNSRLTLDELVESVYAHTYILQLGTTAREVRSDAPSKVPIDYNVKLQYVCMPELRFRQYCLLSSAENTNKIIVPMSTIVGVDLKN